MRIQLEEQTLEQGKELFQTYMHRDFPENECKPWDLTVDMHSRGIYDMLTAWMDGKMVGYAWMVCPEGDAALIDYLAVLPEYRGTGIGSEILKALALRYQLHGKHLILESEHPEEAPDPQIAQRRLGFYKRAGFVDTGLQVRLFGVRFCILAHGISGSARMCMDIIYHAMFSDSVYHAAVEFL